MESTNENDAQGPVHKTYFFLRRSFWAKVLSPFMGTMAVIIGNGIHQGDPTWSVLSGIGGVLIVVLLIVGCFTFAILAGRWEEKGL